MATENSTTISPLGAKCELCPEHGTPALVSLPGGKSKAGSGLIQGFEALFQSNAL